MEPEEKEAAREEERNEILSFGKIVTENEETIQTLVIAGQIEGHTVLPPTVKATRYEHVLPQLVLAEESPEIRGVLFLINTVGGDVEAGLCMAELVSGMTKPTASLVLGGGHSIGIPLAAAATRAFIAPSATMTVHPARVNGLILGVPQSFEYLRKMQERITDFIVSHSQVSREDMEKLLNGRHDMATDIGTILDGAEAQRVGLVDEVGSLSDALRWLKKEIRRRKSIEK